MQKLGIVAVGYDPAIDVQTEVAEPDVGAGEDEEDTSALAGVPVATAASTADRVGTVMAVGGEA